MGSDLDGVVPAERPRSDDFVFLGVSFWDDDNEDLPDRDANVFSRKCKLV